MGSWASHPDKDLVRDFYRDHLISQVRHGEATIKVLATVRILVLVRVFGVWCSVFPRGAWLSRLLCWLPPHLLMLITSISIQAKLSSIRSFSSGNLSSRVHVTQFLTNLAVVSSP